MWVSRTEAPPGCAVLCWQELAFLLGGCCFSPQLCKPGQYSGLTQCRHCPAQGEIPTLSTLVFRMSGCQLSSVAFLCQRLGLSGVPVTEPGLCSRAISWQIVPLCSVLATCVCPCVPAGWDQCWGWGGLQWVLRAQQCQGRHRDSAQSPAEAAPGWGLAPSPAQGMLSKVGTIQGSEGVPGVKSTRNVGMWATDSYTKSCWHSSVSPLQDDNILPSVLTVEIVALEKVWVCKNVMFRWVSIVWDIERWTFMSSGEKLLYNMPVALRKLTKVHWHERRILNCSQVWYRALKSKHWL